MTRYVIAAEEQVTRHYSVEAATEDEAVAKIEALNRGEGVRGIVKVHGPEIVPNHTYLVGEDTGEDIG